MYLTGYSRLRPLPPTGDAGRYAALMKHVPSILIAYDWH